MAPLALALLLALAAPEPPPAPSTRGSIVEVRVPAPSLRGNLLREPAVRHALVYLPPSYERDEDRRFPVVYLLHAFGAGPASWLGVSGYEGLDVGATLNRLIAAGRSEEMIVVMPDARTRAGGSWYANSTTAGRWTDFVARDLVRFVDAAYRTVADRAGRGIAGHSMGGYGALRVALWYPDTFGAVYALSAPNLMSTNPFGVAGMEQALQITDLDALDQAGPVARVLWSKAVAFAPDASDPPFYGRLPWRRGTNGLERDPEPWAAWEASALVNQLDERAAGLRGTALRIDVGRGDPLVSESEGFSEALRRYDVGHDLHRFNGDHVRGVRGRFEDHVFRFFSQALASSDVEEAR